MGTLPSLGQAQPGFLQRPKQGCNLLGNSWKSMMADVWKWGPFIRSHRVQDRGCFPVYHWSEAADNGVVSDKNISEATLSCIPQPRQAPAQAASLALLWSGGRKQTLICNHSFRVCWQDKVWATSFPSAIAAHGLPPPMPHVLHLQS